MSLTNEGPTWLSTGLRLTDWEICRWVVGRADACMLRVLQSGGGSGHRSLREALHPPRTTISMLRYETSFVFLRSAAAGGVPSRVSKDAFLRVPCSRFFANRPFYSSFSTVTSPILLIFFVNALRAQVRIYGQSHHDAHLDNERQACRRSCFSSSLSQSWRARRRDTWPRRDARVCAV